MLYYQLFQMLHGTKPEAVPAQLRYRSDISGLHNQMKEAISPLSTEDTCNQHWEVMNSYFRCWTLITDTIIYLDWRELKMS